MQFPDVIDLIQKVLADRVWDLAGILILIGITTATLIGLEYRESRKSRERTLIAEVLNNMVLPLIDSLRKLTEESNPITTYIGKISIDRYTMDAAVDKEFAEKYFNKLLGRIKRRKFYAKLRKLNAIQEELRQLIEDFKNTLRDTLMNEPRIQNAYRARVNKENYPTLEHFIKRLIEDFYHCYWSRESSAWDWIYQDSCYDYVSKLEKTLKPSRTS